MSHPTINFINSTPNQESPSPLVAPPKSDIYASPKTGFRFSGPISYATIPLRTFRTASAAVRLPFTPSSSDNPSLQYDQAGLILVLLEKGKPIPSKDSPGDRETHPRWVKVGLEVVDGRVFGSVVARETWSDWSLFERRCGREHGSRRLMVCMERMGDALGVYAFSEEDGEAKTLVRKVPWVFLEEGNGAVESVLVGVFAGRPDPRDQAVGKNLEVVVEGWSINGKELI